VVTTLISADDTIHLFWKFCQICVFIYVGAASSNWSLSTLEFAPKNRVDDGNLDSFDIRISSEEAQDAFKTVVSAYLASRAVLTLQYLICEFSIHIRPLRIFEILFQ
jgi:hypothetical protein